MLDRVFEDHAWAPSCRINLVLVLRRSAWTCKQLLDRVEVSLFVHFFVRHQWLDRIKAWLLPPFQLLRLFAFLHLKANLTHLKVRFCHLVRRCKLGFEVWGQDARHNPCQSVKKKLLPTLTLQTEAAWLPQILFWLGWAQV